MKKFSTVLLMISFAAIFGVLLTNCKKTENTPPTVTITGITDGTTYNLGEIPDVIITTGAVDSKLVSLTIDVTGALPASITDLNATASVPSDALDQTVTSSPFAFKSGLTNAKIYYNVKVSSAGTVALRFTVKDSNDEITQVTVTFTVTVPQIVNNTITLGDQASSTGSFGASYEGSVFTTSQVASNYSKIDMIYYYDATNGDALYSPDDVDIHTQTWGGVIDWASWTPQNSTRFVFLGNNPAPEFFDSATYQDIIDNTATTTDQVAIGLTLGDVFGFKTVSNRMGVLKITAISTTTGGTVTFDVKIIQ
ncbi:MAG: hypothetical protein NTW49_01005 [Bacteroidia bacterium]|nr:hypothetical protein [Bacteroidia bacterium]